MISSEPDPRFRDRIFCAVESFEAALAVNVQHSYPECVFMLVLLRNVGVDSQGIRLPIELLDVMIQSARDCMSGPWHVNVNPGRTYLCATTVIEKKPSIVEEVMDVSEHTCSH